MDVEIALLQYAGVRNRLLALSLGHQLTVRGKIRVYLYDMDVGMLLGLEWKEGF